MNEHEWLAERFEQDRSRLRAVAYRMLGSEGDADDAVQEAWIRLHRSDTTDVQNLSGWLTTVVARVSLDMLRANKSRREEPLAGQRGAPVGREGGPDPEGEAVLADSLGPALLLVLQTLSPTERLAFVLHDMFAVPFDEIAPIVGAPPPRPVNSPAGHVRGCRDPYQRRCRHRRCCRGIGGRKWRVPHPRPTATASARSSTPF